ncbi:MAG: ComEC/Rec2 family competence protein [Geminicoccaceae bacterium]
MGGHVSWHDLFLVRSLAGELEAERRRWFLWLPVLLGTGIATFFALHDPPPLWIAFGGAAGAAAAVVLAGVVWRTHGATGAILLALALPFAGFGLAQYRLHAVAAPILAHAGVYEVAGRVVAMEPLRSGDRVLLDGVTLEGVPSAVTPDYVRINLRRSPDGLEPGDRLAVRARLQRPLGPTLPGGFDFGRQAWFERLGAIGYSVGPARRTSSPAADADLAIAELRAHVAARIAGQHPGPAGGMAAALVAGVRAGIDQETWRAMQVSGLAHILSVSGLHMVMVGGSMFAVCRWLLALIPPLALRYPVKKLAAAMALAALTFYLLLSGASVPAQRSYLMTAVALVAVMVDRNPFSLRLLAWAAIVVLLLRPEAVFGASFQLSFAAVLALMVVMEAWQRRRRESETETGLARVVLRYLAGLSATPLIAGAATMPFAAFHFQTIPTYGVLANLVAVPITTFLVMPAGMLGLILMPLGWEWPFFHLMGLGCAAVLAVARFIAGLPGASVLIPQWPGIALALLAAGGLWVALWRRPWRWLGLAPAVLALGLGLWSRPPDILVTPRLTLAAVRAQDGGVTLVERERDRLVRDSWLRNLGVAAAAKAPAPGSGATNGVACDASGCVVDLAGTRISLAFRADAAIEDCALVALVIARAGPERCARAEMIGPRALLRSDGLAVRRTGEGLEVRTVADWRGAWPWAAR